MTERFRYLGNHDLVHDELMDAAAVFHNDIVRLDVFGQAFWTFNKRTTYIMSWKFQKI